jgi:hypothetical protein
MVADSNLSADLIILARNRRNWRNCRNLAHRYGSHDYIRLRPLRLIRHEFETDPLLVFVGPRKDARRHDVPPL